MLRRPFLCAAIRPQPLVISALAMRTSRMSWLAISMGMFCVSVISLPLHRFFALLRPVQAEPGKIEMEGMARIAVGAGVNTAMAMAPPERCRVHTSTSPSE